MLRAVQGRRMEVLAWTAVKYRTLGLEGVYSGRSIALLHAEYYWPLRPEDDLQKGVLYLVEIAKAQKILQLRLAAAD